MSPVDLSPPNPVGTVEDLHASATRVAGLSDFGADAYRDGLAVLLESYARDADLTPLGRQRGVTGFPHHDRYDADS